MADGGDSGRKPGTHFCTRRTRGRRSLAPWSRRAKDDEDLNTNISAAPIVAVGSATFGNDLPLAMIAGPVPARKPRACARGGLGAEGDRGAARNWPCLQDLVRQGQPHQRVGRARARPRTVAADLRRDQLVARPAGADRRARCRAVRRGRASRRYAADPGVPVPADRPAARRRRDRPGRQRQEGPVPGALGHGQCGGEDHQRRQSAMCW